MIDPRLVPGVWVDTRFGPAVAIEIRSHDHSLVMREPSPGRMIHPCEDDRCAGASLVYYRYRARRPNADKDIWVVNGDLTAGSDAATFLREADDESTHVLTLTGPYGEGPILPPLPPPIEPAGPVRAERASDQEALSLEFEYVLLHWPDFSNYDLLDPAVKTIWDAWAAWGQEVISARLAEFGWTQEEYNSLCEAETKAFYAQFQEFRS